MGEAHAVDQVANVASYLDRSLDLKKNELNLLGKLFVEIAASKNIDRSDIFDRLKISEPTVQTLDASHAIVEFLYKRALKWFRAGHFDRAEAIFRALCILDTSSADFHVGLGICLRRRSAWHDALDAFEAAARLRPEWAIPRFHMLELLMRRGEWKRGAEELAAFEARLDRNVPPALTSEVARFRAALALRSTEAESRKIAL